MYSRLNILVNEIYSLNVKKIENLELIRKILHSLRRPDYDLVTTILYEKDINTMTQNQVLNKVIAHELCHDIKPRACFWLACMQVHYVLAIKDNSSEEEEEEACQTSSSDD